MVELLVKERDLGDYCVELLLGLSSTPYHHGEVGTTIVSNAWVDAANTVILIFAHVWHVVFFLVHVLPVKEFYGVERSLLSESCPVSRSRLDIEAEFLTLTHGVNELFPNVLTHLSICLPIQAHFDDFRSQRCELSLVLHEGTNASLLVPDEQVLIGFFGVDDSSHKLLEGVLRPGFYWIISFYHFLCFV